ncbi:65-kDa microtubule-associated protein 8 [Linum grandiflorum]
MGSIAMMLQETSCGYLLQELHMIWDEVGEPQFHREKVLLDMEQECLEVYRRKVDGANVSRSRLHQELAESEAELTRLLLSLGEQRSLPGRPEKVSGTLKEQLDAITPALREMRLRKEDRVNQFRSVQSQIERISAEIAGQSLYCDDLVTNVTVNENDLSMKRLEEYQSELQRLHKEKNDRLEQVEKHTETIQNLCLVLGMESSMIITKVHPTLNDLCGITKNISDTILSKLSSTVESLKEEKQNRTDKLYHVAKALTKLWNLIDTPYEDRHRFFHVTNLLRGTPQSLTDEGSLALNIIQDAEDEVKRLDQLKASKTKELFFRKRSELEGICSRSHMVVPNSRSDVETIVNLIDSGEIDHANLLTSMDEQISKAREEASSRKGIMEKVERWMLARDEECWLEEYSRDENRYSVSRGAHRNLRRAERARILVSKIPDLLGSVVARTKHWEDERSKVFLYDNVPLLAIVEEYRLLRVEKEEEKLRQKGIMKKLQVQVTESAAEYSPFSSRPGTSSTRRLSNNLSNRRLSMSSSIQPFGNCNGRKMHDITKVSSRRGMTPRFQDETASVVSTFSGPMSP